jgi:DNA polymerase III delta subunit
MLLKMPMHLLIHGDNLIQSRNELQNQKKAYSEIITLFGPKLTLSDLLVACESGSLFGVKRLIVIDNLFKNPSKINLKKLIAYLNLPENYQVDIILWSSSKLTSSTVKPFSHWTIKSFNASPVIFSFVDTLSFSLFREACNQDGPEFVFNMLIRQIINLIQVIYHVSPLPPWQQQRLQSQIDRLSSKRVHSLFDALVDLDWRLKSGQTMGTLESELGFLLAKF